MPDHDPSIENEPHLRPVTWGIDPSEYAAARRLREEAERGNGDDLIDQSVWNEPSLAGELVTPAADDPLVYANWLERRRLETSWLSSWLTTLLIAMAAGPFAILSALLAANAGGTFMIGFHAVLIGPLTEEIVKIAIPLWVVERRPFWFRSPVQLILCALAGGLVFAAVENVMYLREDLFNWENSLTRWRWTICVALHSFCCLISSLGLLRIWSTTFEEKTPPQIQLGVPYFVTAIVLHGCYNAFAIAFEKWANPF